MFEPLPSSPPPLQQILVLSDQARNQAARRLRACSDNLSELPVVLSQGGDLETYAGDVSDTFAGHIAELADRTWREGATRPAREYLRFHEMVFHQNESRLSVMLYSLHVAGALTLTAGWQFSSVSLTLLRSEMTDAVEYIRALLED